MSISLVSPEEDFASFFSASSCVTSPLCPCCSQWFKLLPVPLHSQFILILKLHSFSVAMPEVPGDTFLQLHIIPHNTPRNTRFNHMKLPFWRTKMVDNWQLYMISSNNYWYNCGHLQSVVNFTRAKSRSDSLLQSQCPTPNPSTQ